MTRINWEKRFSGGSIGPRRASLGDMGKVSEFSLSRERTIDMQCAQFNFKLWEARVAAKLARGLDATKEQELMNKYQTQIRNLSKDA